MKPHNSRKLLPDEDAAGDTLSPSDPLLQPINGTSSSGPGPNLPKAQPFRPNSPLDSSMALTALVLLTALFFMGFFSLYLRRFADDGGGGSPVNSRRRSRSRPPPYSSSTSSFPSWRSNFQKGLDSSAVRSLPLVSYGGDAKHSVDCVICLCEFEERETVKLIPYCGHVFHPDCIDTWLVSHVSCPLCRSFRLFVIEEVPLGVSREEIDRGVTENEGRSTVEIGETWGEEDMEVGSVGMRRACSYPSLGDRVVLQRSSSF